MIVLLILVPVLEIIVPMLPLVLLMIPPAMVLSPFRVIPVISPLVLEAPLVSPTAILPPIPVPSSKVMFPILALALLLAPSPFTLISPVIVELFARVISPMVAVLVSVPFALPVSEIPPVSGN